MDDIIYFLFNYPNDTNCDVSHHSNELNGLLSSINRGNVLINSSGDAKAPSCLVGEPVLTPDVRYLMNRNNNMNKCNAEENRYFIAICRIADSSKWQSFDAVDIDNVKVKIYNFGHSLKKGGFVSNYVMSVFCRVMFHNNHPPKSKNYFFPSIGLYFPIYFK